MSLAAQYLDAATGVLNHLRTSQAEHLRAASYLVARSWETGGRLLVAKTNHTLHEELVFRAGGPVAVSVLDDGGAAYNECVVALLNVAPSDTVLIHSNCGTTAKVISIAMAAKAIGAATIGLTQLSFEMSAQVRSEHPSGARLNELCDVIVDLGGKVGDGALELPGSGLRVAPLSGLSGVAAAWAMVAGACDLLATRALEPLLLQSVQLEGAAEHNATAQALWEKTGIAVTAMPRTSRARRGASSNMPSNMPPKATGDATT